jgi:hypothetical protein
MIVDPTALGYLRRAHINVGSGGRCSTNSNCEAKREDKTKVPQFLP